jgi:hypothetical protein
VKYIQELSKLAERLGCKGINLKYDKEKYLYRINIETVVYKEKHLRQNIYGSGFTVDDACYDFIRKCRGGELENYMTDKIIEVI